MESLCSDSQCRKEQSERSRITPVSPFPPVRRLYICVGVGVNSVSCLHCPFLSLKVPRGARTCPVAPPAAADTQGRGCSRRSSRVSRSCWSWSWNGPGHGRGGLGTREHWASDLPTWPGFPGHLERPELHRHARTYTGDLRTVSVDPDGVQAPPRPHPNALACGWEGGPSLGCRERPQKDPRSPNRGQSTCWVLSWISQPTHELQLKAP